MSSPLVYAYRAVASIKTTVPFLAPAATEIVAQWGKAGLDCLPMPTPISPDSVPKTQNFDLSRVGGFALLGVGIALLVCRYAFWPVAMEGPMRLAVGAGVGLMIGGGKLITNGIENRVAEFAAMFASAAIVAAIMYFGFAPPAFGDLPLKVIKAEGIQISLPEGTLDIDEVAGRGKINAHDFGAAGSTTVSWQPGVDFSEEDFVNILSGIGKEVGITFHKDSESTISGHQGLRYISGEGKMQGVFSMWLCEEHQRTYFVLTGSKDSQGEVRKLHERILESAACHLGDKRIVKVPMPILPSDVEVGYAEASSPAIFLTPKAETLIFSTQNKDSFERLSKTPFLIKMAMASDSDVELTSFSDMTGGAAWHAITTGLGQHYWTELRVMRCSAYLLVGISYRLIAGSDAPALEPSKLLHDAECPNDSALAPRTVANLAEEVCLRGDVEGCYNLVNEASQNEEQHEAWLRQSCDAGTTSACAAFEPSQDAAAE